MLFSTGRMVSWEFDDIPEMHLGNSSAHVPKLVDQLIYPREREGVFRTNFVQIGEIHVDSLHFPFFFLTTIVLDSQVGYRTGRIASVANNLSTSSIIISDLS